MILAQQYLHRKIVSYVRESGNFDRSNSIVTKADQKVSIYTSTRNLPLKKKGNRLNAATKLLLKTTTKGTSISNIIVLLFAKNPKTYLILLTFYCLVFQEDMDSY